MNESSRRRFTKLMIGPLTAVKMISDHLFLFENYDNDKTEMSAPLSIKKFYLLSPLNSEMLWILNSFITAVVLPVESCLNNSKKEYARVDISDDNSFFNNDNLGNEQGNDDSSSNSNNSTLLNALNSSHHLTHSHHLVAYNKPTPPPPSSTQTHNNPTSSLLHPLGDPSGWIYQVRLHRHHPRAIFMINQYHQWHIYIVLQPARWLKGFNSDATIHKREHTWESASKAHCHCGFRSRCCATTATAVNDLTYYKRQNHCHKSPAAKGLPTKRAPIVAKVDTTHIFLANGPATQRRKTRGTRALKRPTPTNNPTR
uniref:Uncharacterized protein n=1 Tax=Glossina pallidipes TaxID=7398 RepID=A0A1A9ZSP7_GLOPL